jgi:hypothetical protein
MTSPAGLARLTRDGIRQRISEAREAREPLFPPALVDLVAREAEAAAMLFSPHQGYLTTPDEIRAAGRRATAWALDGIWSSLSHAIALELTLVRAPEFVAPAAGSWVSKRVGSNPAKAWHRTTGDVGPARSRTDWPSVRTRCGQQLRASWDSEGRGIVKLLTSATRPDGRVCGRCERLSVK